jgi:hypothetical protein
MKLTKTQLKQIIKEELEKNIKEVSFKPKFRFQPKANNLIAAIYFSWNKQSFNTSSLWDSVIKILQDNDCTLVNYVVTNSICEFEFRPSASPGQDELEETKFNVQDALKTLSDKFTKHDIYIVGN